jgi:ABC-2 type transport system permease protein
MRGAATTATAVRVLSQLRRDPRTMALLLVVPTLLVAIFEWVYLDQPAVFDRIGVPLLGVFPLVSMFLVTSISMLRERTLGTLERLMSMPLKRIDLLAGYGIAFGLAAAIKGTVVSGVAFGLLDLNVSGSPFLVVLLAIANALLGMSLGLLVSAFASTEFQAVQFMPAIILPQLILYGLVAPRDKMARPLEIVSDYLPMTYAYDGLARVATSPSLSGWLARDVAVVVGVTVAALGLGALTLKRRTP